jgi:hypothetical protein
LRVFPYRWPGFPGVFDDDAEAHLAALLERRTEDPDAGRFHLDDGIDAFSDCERDDLDFFWAGDRVAVHGDNAELVAGKCEDYVFGGGGVKQPHEDALALFDADRIARAKAVLIDGGVLIADVGA